MVYESEPRRSAQLTPAFPPPPVPNTSIIERERQVHLWAKCLSQKLSQEAKPPGTKPSTSLKGTEKPFARTYISETKNCQVCMWQFGMWTSTSTRTRGSCVSLYKGTHLMCMSSCFGGRCFSPPPSEPVTLPSAQSTFQEPSRSHTHTLTRGVTRGSDGAKNNPSCRHKRAGEHTAVCCRKSVCVCVCVCVCGRTAAVTALSLSLLPHFPSGIVSDMTGVRGCESVSFSGVLPALAVSLSSLSFFSFHFLLGKLHAPVVSSPAPSRSPQSLVNIKEMLVRPLPLSLSLSLSRFFLVYTPSSPLPSLFFLTVKAAFQMLISTQSKRERGRVELWLAFG